MGIWSAIFKTKDDRSVQRQVKAAGVLRDEEGWYYEESRNFSRTQSTVRIDQHRPGDWETLASSCGIVGLNKPERQKEVGRFFAGSYRWLRLDREVDAFLGNSLIKVTGTYRDKGGKERTTHLGYINRELAEELEGEDIANLWARIRFIRFPTPGRDSKHLIRFDLMQRVGLQQIA